MTFLKSKTAKRFAWTLLNSLSAVGLAVLIYIFYPNIFADVIIIPVATALSQMFTKYLNTAKPTL